jgi:hypothetical protein
MFLLDNTYSKFASYCLQKESEKSITHFDEQAHHHYLNPTEFINNTPYSRAEHQFSNLDTGLSSQNQVSAREPVT